jgi:plasmid replication initiation protein
LIGVKNGESVFNGGSENVQYVTVGQVAKMLQVSERWVYKHWGKLGGKKLVGKIRFDKEIVERTMRAN